VISRIEHVWNIKVISLRPLSPLNPSRPTVPVDLSLSRRGRRRLFPRQGRGCGAAGNPGVWFTKRRMGVQWMQRCGGCGGWVSLHLRLCVRVSVCLSVSLVCLTLPRLRPSLAPSLLSSLLPPSLPPSPLPSATALSWPLIRPPQRHAFCHHLIFSFPPFDPFHSLSNPFTANPTVLDCVCSNLLLSTYILSSPSSGRFSSLRFLVNLHFSSRHLLISPCGARDAIDRSKRF
jgi:hypothetical protein